MLLEEGGNQRLAHSFFSSLVASSESDYVSADGGVILYLDSVPPPNRGLKQPIRASQKVHRNEVSFILVVALIATYAF